MRFTKADRVSEEDRFWSKVEVGNVRDCWPWLATKDKKNYGMFSIKRRPNRSSHMIRSHRYSLELKENRHLLPEEEACHSCDNPICCNPNHIFLGTHLDNMNDMALKGRTAGEKHSRAKLSDEQAKEATNLRLRGFSIKYISEIYNISPSQMSRITRGQRKFSPS